MALTAAEEAQTRELLAQQAAILSLADSEPAIISNLGATDVSLSDLTAATAINDTDLMLVRQGTTDKSVTPSVIGFSTKTGVQQGAYTVATSAGTADAITIALSPAQIAFSPGPTWWRATAANTTTTPTVKRDGLSAKTLVKGNNIAVVAGDIPGDGAWMCSQYDATLDKEVLLNPASGVFALGNRAQNYIATTGSRIPGVTYYNIYPTALFVYFLGPNVNTTAYVNGYQAAYSANTAALTNNSVSFIVPPGGSYRIENGSVTSFWSELT